MQGFSVGTPHRRHDYRIVCNTTDERYSIQNETGETVKIFKTWDKARSFRDKLELDGLLTQAKTRKRPKTIFPTGEIPHLWMHQVQERASNATHNVYFEGSTIYSYGEHFPMARHVTNKRGDKAILINSRRYSVTTSGHQSAVRQAIPTSVLTFDVPKVGMHYSSRAINHAANLQYLKEQLEDRIGKAARARISHAIDWQVREARSLRDSAIKYAKFFGLRAPKLPEVPKPDSKKMAAIREKEKEASAKKAAQSKIEAQQRREQVAKQRAEYESVLPVRIQQWRDGQDVRIPYVPYRLYGYDEPKPVIPTMLRIEQDEVVTSMGARVPVSHAKRGLTFVRKVVKSGQEYVRNGHTLHLGRYAIDRIETNGTLHAGCHVIPLAEIERIAPALDARKLQENAQ